MASTKTRAAVKRANRRVPGMRKQDREFLRALPFDVDLDLAQISAATDQLPPAAIKIVRRLIAEQALETVAIPGMGTRFKRIAAI